MMFIFKGTILIIILTFVENEIYLYNTKDGFSLEYYDCVILQSLYYCRRPSQPINLTRDKDISSCQQNGGQFHRFSELQSNHINITTILHQWKSGIDSVEQYSRYRRNSSSTIDGYLCQCTQSSSSFGKNCEYRLPFGDTFQQTLDWQLQMKETNLNKVQIHGDIICYETLKCYSGLLCLDWRDICDGIHQCMDGSDEMNCDLLEMNVCGDDEYRCMNGMCIPDLYFLDGQFDCLDWSDEIQYKLSEDCAQESVSSQCDDHICPPNQWSCGDGQCIRDRLAFQFRKDYMTCYSRRDQYFMCETDRYPLTWTMSNGRCHEGKQYKAPLLINRTKKESCEYLFRCDLSRGGERNCPCFLNDTCWEKLQQDCFDRKIQYPKGPLIAPYIFSTWEQGKKMFLINGTIKCRDSSISISTLYLWGSSQDAAVRKIHYFLCQSELDASNTKVSADVEDCHRQNESIDICNEWNPCMSITRRKDGFDNCLNKNDESEHLHIDIDQSCSRVYRFRCSNIQVTCLSVMALGNEKWDCDNRFDVFWFGTNFALSEMSCNDQRTDQCSLLRHYIKQSWNSTDREQMFIQNIVIPFRSYCDTFWDLNAAGDENIIECEQWWVCPTDEERCQTSQCFDLGWKIDYEWDCSNAGDERRYLDAIVEKVQQQNALAPPLNNKSYFLSNSCNQTDSFLCLYPHLSFPQFYCIDQRQIGNGKIDCAGAVDEQMTLQHCSRSSMLGPSFLCLSTNTCIPFYLHCQQDFRCPNQIDDEFWCSHQIKSSNCQNVNDFICFNGTCLLDARCDRYFECPFAEDEYMCDYASTDNKKIIPFRAEKQLQRRTKRKIFFLPQFPQDAYIIDEYVNPPITPSLSFNASTSSSSLSSYWCNRGIGILSTNDSILCFCPLQYYGDKCQYHNDRLSILFHLDLSLSNYISRTTDVNIILKLLFLFFYDNQILMTDESDVRPQLDSMTIEKKMIYFLYSNSSIFHQQRIDRYHNRSSLLHLHPYSIQIELYQMYKFQRPTLTAVWKYSIHFDNLPVFRLSKVLYLIQVNKTHNPCLDNPCHPNEECHQLMNNISQHICLCKANYGGENCSIEDEQCISGYCASSSLCKPSYRLLDRGNTQPYCICPSGRIGDQCDIEHDLCQSKPCQHGGTCFPSSRPDQVICLCTKEYYGGKCELNKFYIRLSVNMTLHYAGVTIQFFDINFISLNLHLVHQQAHRSPPRSIEYYHTEQTVPDIVLGKAYSSYDDISPDFYLLSLYVDAKFLDGKTEMSDINRCQHVRQAFNGYSPIRYHQICINNSNILCFRDDNYLCICVDNHRRVECFLYDHQLDRCPHCLSGGRCLKGDQNHRNDFVCLCPPCYSGEQCQFSSRSFTFTLDQLFYTDLVSNQYQTTISLLILFSLLGFLIAIPNNIFSFLTFRRQSCLRNGNGHYLLCLSIINQLNLGLFVARLIHLAMNITGRSSSSTLNTILCKLLNYFLVSSSRMVFWFSSLIAIERVYMTLVLNGQWLKQPRIARRLIVISIIGILLSTVYEFLFYKSLSNANIGQRSMCVFEFPMTYRSQWALFHISISTLNSIVPLVINLCSTITISIVVVKKKMNTLKTKKKSKGMNFQGRVRFILSVLNENKELVIGPGITLIPQLFSLPLFISSFTLHCQNIDNNWLRYLLITSYWTSFTPQFIGFFLYISPSSFYSDEWRKTKIGRWINSIFSSHQSERTTTTTASTAFSNTRGPRH